MTDRVGEATGETDAPPCWASVSFGDILLVRCAERGKHIAHVGSMPTETRPAEPRASGVQMKHSVYWYDTGAVRIDDEGTPR